MIWTLFFKSWVPQIPKAKWLAFGNQSIWAEVAASSYEARTFGIQFKKAYVDKFYVDMTCMDKFFDCQQYIQVLRKKTRDPLMKS